MGSGSGEHFSAKYKAETVRLIQRSGKSIGQMALELGIGDTALRRWVAQAEIEAGRARCQECSWPQDLPSWAGQVQFPDDASS